MAAEKQPYQDTVMLKRKLFPAALAFSLVSATAMPALADATHDHPRENGTAAAPLDIVRVASDLARPVKRDGPETIKVKLDTVEVTGSLADGATYHYWTFNRKVPGPFIRARLGDTIEVEIKNMADSSERHSVDFHAVTGPGGGAVATDAAPGETKGFTFKVLKPGLYVYHCAVPLAAHHIANGMYGLILVEPEKGLPPVDREFYVMQGEIYTSQPFGTKGKLTESQDRLMDETPEYYVFNGAANALTGDNALTGRVGETVRIFFGVGGPNKTSSFHVVGEIFDKAYPLASLTSDPLTNVQTISVPPGGAAVVDLTLDAPGEYVLVDHALSRAARGLIGKLFVEGEEKPDVFRSDPARDAQTAHGAHSSH